ncbi:hypothetical protein N7G274_001325 [Stereocaulon virgatum]|uniref:Uncharacterized protein n=1 Tax=Stereocaulon virgatum TaxID=373712 RepID=A0ABR4AP46_9LECA
MSEDEQLSSVWEYASSSTTRVSDDIDDSWKIQSRPRRGSSATVTLSPWPTPGTMFSEIPKVSLRTPGAPRTTNIERGYIRSVIATPHCYHMIIDPADGGHHVYAPYSREDFCMIVARIAEEIEPVAKLLDADVDSVLPQHQGEEYLNFLVGKIFKFLRVGKIPVSCVLENIFSLEVQNVWLETESDIAWRENLDEFKEIVESERVSTNKFKGNAESRTTRPRKTHHSEDDADPNYRGRPSKHSDIVSLDSSEPRRRSERIAQCDRPNYVKGLSPIWDD